VTGEDKPPGLADKSNKELFKKVIGRAQLNLLTSKIKVNNMARLVRIIIHSGLA